MHPLLSIFSDDVTIACAQILPAAKQPSCLSPITMTSSTYQKVMLVIPYYKKGVISLTIGATMLCGIFKEEG